MKSINILTITCFLAVSVSCSNEKPSEQKEPTPIEENQKASKGLSDFLDEILLGYEMSAVQKHMVQTPYQLLGETDLLINYEAQDANNVTHFVSFHKHTDSPEQLQALVYNIDFKNNNAHLVMEYQENLIKQLDAVYGEWSEDFQTGYNNDGLYEAEWLFEAGVLLITVGIDYITVDLHEH